MTTVRFSCCKCDKNVKASIRHAGLKGKCPQCGAMNTVPEHGQDELLTSVTRILDLHELEGYEDE